jgi:hypothetical protein
MRPLTHTFGWSRRARCILISAADLPAIREWTELIWGRYNQNIIRVSARPSSCWRSWLPAVPRNLQLLGGT